MEVAEGGDCVRMHRSADSARRPGTAYSLRRSLRDPVRADAQRERGHHRPWCQRGRRGYRDRFMRELHYELHNADHGDSGSAHRSEESDGDGDSCLHRQSVHRRRLEAQTQDGSRRGDEYCSHVDRCGNRNDEAHSERYRHVLGVTADPVVSSDIIKDPRAAVVDLGLTQRWRLAQSDRLVRQRMGLLESDGPRSHSHRKCGR